AARRRTGAGMSHPTGSPRHQPPKGGGEWAVGVSPPSHRLRGPKVADTVVLSPAAKAASIATSRTRSSELLNPARFNKYTPTTASSVLPTAIPTALGRGTCPVSALTSNAPRAT